MLQTLHIVYCSNDSRFCVCLRYHSTWCVGSTDKDYKRSGFSNWGSHINVFGPGSDIISASITGGLDKWVKMSGTSMATPFVAGILATFVSVDGCRYGENTYATSAYNCVYDSVTNLPWPGEYTTSRFATSGLNTPGKIPDQPFRHPYFAAQSEERGETCKLDITEVWTCESKLYARMSIKDSKDNKLYSAVGTTTTPGVPLGKDEKRLVIENENMYHALVIEGEAKNVDVRFRYNDLEWTTGTKGGQNKCKLEGEDWPADGPGACNSEAKVSCLLNSYCPSQAFSLHLLASAYFLSPKPLLHLIPIPA